MNSVILKAALLSGIVTLASLPRYLHLRNNSDPWLLAGMLGFQFVLLIVVADAPVAWGRRAGMVGIWPERRRLGQGLLLAGTAAVLLIPLHLGMDPHLRAAIEAAGQEQLLRAAYPTAGFGVVSVMLWAAGFEVLFFYGFAMSLAGRITGRLWVAVLTAAALRTFVSGLKLSEAGLPGSMAGPLLLGLVTSMVAALVYARGGFVSASVLLLLLASRHLVWIW